MIFNSTQFLIFFPIVVLIYFVLPKKVRNYWLLAASYYFYMCWNAKYLILIFTSTLITYLSGLSLSRINISEKIAADKKKLWLNTTVAVSFVSNLGILFVFKYYNFFARVSNIAISKIGISFNIPAVDLLLPVGISFYTFQALSYTMDVYRHEIAAEKNFFKYALFVSFFPQLVAGPIERSKNLLGQLDADRKFNLDKAREGLLLMLWGYFLKIVLADRIAVFVDNVYSGYETYAGWYLIIASVLFAFQIYCDFYGYSTIAMGSALILGIDLMENFNAPYLSTSVAEFWRKWHISLTSWFRDYLYIPLGGSRKGRIRKYINIMIVFLVSGLWHGASFTYVIWGGLNGFFQIVGDILKPVREKLNRILGMNPANWSHKLVKLIATFIMVDFTWVFFRASGIREALVIIKRMFIRNPWVLFDDSLFTCGLDAKDFNVVIVSLLVLLIADILKHRGILIRKQIAAQNFWFRCIAYIVVISIILTYGIWGPGYNAGNFIYFQF